MLFRWRRPGRAQQHLLVVLQPSSWLRLSPSLHHPLLSYRRHLYPCPSFPSCRQGQFHFLREREEEEVELQQAEEEPLRPMAPEAHQLQREQPPEVEVVLPRHQAAVEEERWGREPVLHRGAVVEAHHQEEEEVPRRLEVVVEEHWDRELDLHQGAAEEGHLGQEPGLPPEEVVVALRWDQAAAALHQEVVEEVHSGLEEQHLDREAAAAVLR